MKWIILGAKHWPLFLNNDRILIDVAHGRPTRIKTIKGSDLEKFANTDWQSCRASVCISMNYDNIKTILLIRNIMKCKVWKIFQKIKFQEW